MKAGYLLLFPILAFSFSASAQDPVYTLPDEQRDLIDRGTKCLREKESNCKAFFEEAISISAKSGADSTLAQTYFEICNALDFVGNSEDHIDYAKRGLELDGNNHPLVTNRLLRELGYAYSKAGVVDSLVPVYKRAIHWAEVARDSSEIAISRIRLASSYRRLGDIKTSIEILLETRPFAKASNDIHRVSGLSFTLANAYLSNGDFDLAISNYEEAANGFLTAEDPAMYAASLVNLSMAANENGREDLALKKLPKAIEILEKENPNSAIYAKTHLAKAHYLSGNLEKAINTGLSSLKEAIETGNKILENLNRKNLAQAYLDRGELDMALKESTLVYQDEMQRGVSDGFLTALKLQAEVLTANGKSDQAVGIYQNYIHTKDSIFTVEKEKEIANMRELFEAEKREARIKLLEQDVALSNLQKTTFGIGMFSFIAIALLIFIGLKLKIRKNKIEGQKQAEIYKQQIAHKQKELASQTLHLVQKSTFIQELRENLEKIKQSPELFKIEFRRLVLLLRKHNAEDKNWEVFKSYFSEVHNDFDKVLKKLCSEITEKEVRLASFLRMKLTTKEIASLLNVLPESVLKSKYRLKKKLALEKDENLDSFLEKL